MNTEFITEVVRNTSGYFLVTIGLIALYVGGHVNQPKLQDAGYALVTASLLAFQAKRSPDGNTATTQVNVPPPAVADAPPVPKPQP